MESLKLSISGQFLIDLKEKDYALYNITPVEVKGLGEILRFRGEKRVLSVYASYRCSFGGKEQQQLHEELQHNIEAYLDKLISSAPMEYQGQIEDVLVSAKTSPLRIFIIELLVRCAKEKPQNFAVLYEVVRNKIARIGFTLKVEEAMYLLLFFYYADETTILECYSEYSYEIKNKLKGTTLDHRIEEEILKLQLKNTMI